MLTYYGVRCAFFTLKSYYSTHILNFLDLRTSLYAAVLLLLTPTIQLIKQDFLDQRTSFYTALFLPLKLLYLTHSPQFLVYSVVD